MAESETDEKESTLTGEGAAARAKPRLMLGNPAMATVVTIAHALTHVYSQGFYIVIPVVYKQFGLAPLEAGLIDAVRWVSSGLSGLFIGFIVDMYQHRRGLFLGISMLVLATGYFLVSLSPTYGLIILALAFAHLGSAMWHPPAIGLLSERFPKRRGMLISLHRGTGSIGDTVGPLIVGFLLVTLTWHQTLRAGYPLAILFTIALWVLLWNVGRREDGHKVGFRDNLRNRVAAFRLTSRNRGLLLLMAITALRGMGDRSLFLFIPLYLAENLKMDTTSIGFHMGLLTFLAIGGGPVLGALSDRIGRKAVLILVLFVSAAITPLMAVAGSGVWLTVTIVVFGIFLYSVNSLCQAAAMDIVHGMRLEGTLIGILWGNNALFSAISPIVVGALASAFGFKIVFYYAAALFLISGLLSLRLPARQNQPVK